MYKEYKLIDIYKEHVNMIVDSNKDRNKPRVIFCDFYTNL